MLKRKADIVSIILVPKSQLTKGAAREALQKEIAKQAGQNLGGKIMKDDSVTFGWFVRNRYLPSTRLETCDGEGEEDSGREGSDRDV